MDRAASTVDIKIGTGTAINGHSNTCGICTRGKIDDARVARRPGAVTDENTAASCCRISAEQTACNIDNARVVRARAKECEPIAASILTEFAAGTDC